MSLCESAHISNAMMDQKQKFFKHLTCEYNYVGEGRDRVVGGKVQLVFITPEALIIEQQISIYLPTKSSAFVVDEAHCVKI